MKNKTIKRHLNRFKQTLDKTGDNKIIFDVFIITDKKHKLYKYYNVLSDALYDNDLSNNFGHETMADLIDSLIYLVNEKEKIKTLDDLEDLNDWLTEISDNAVNVYTKDLTEWLASDIKNVHYLTDAINEYNATDGFNALATAQFHAIYEINEIIYSAIINFLKSK